LVACGNARSPPRFASRLAPTNAEHQRFFFPLVGAGLPAIGCLRQCPFTATVREQAGSYKNTKTCGIGADLQHHLNAFALHQIQQLERRPAGAFVAYFLLLHGGHAGVQNGRKHRLADLLWKQDVSE
jgi:hypothetical protein